MWNSEASLQAPQARLYQSWKHYPERAVRMVVGQEFNAPFGDRAVCLRLDIDDAGIVRGGDTRHQRIAIGSLRVVDVRQAFDDFPAVARLEPADLAQALADQAGSRHCR